MERLRDQPTVRAVQLPAGAITLLALGVLGILVALQILPTASLNVSVSVVLVAAALWLSFFSASSSRFSSPAFLFTGITLILVYIGDVVLYLTEGLPDPLLVSLGMVAFSAGAFMTGSRWNSKPAPVPAPLRSSNMALSLGILLALCLVVVILLFRLGAGALLGTAFRSNYVALSDAAPSYSLGIALYAPMLASVLLLAQACARGSRRMFVVAFIWSLLCAVLWTRLGERYPIFYLAIGWLVVITQFRPRWRAMYVVIAIISVILMIAAFTYVGSSKSDAFAGISNPIALAWAVIYERVIYSQSHVVATIMNIIPSDFPYFGGSTLTGQLFRFPLSSGPAPFSLATWIFPLLNPDIGGNRVIGYAPPTVFGEFYANFGPVVAVVLMIPMGVALGLIDRWLRPLATANAGRVAVYALIATVCCISTSSIYTTLRSVEYIVALGVIGFGVVWVLDSRHARRRGSGS